MTRYEAPFWRDLPAWMRALLGLGALAFLAWGFVRVIGLFTPFLAAFAVAYFLNPALNAFERRLDPWLERTPIVGRRIGARALGIALVLGGVAVALTVVAVVGVPALAAQVGDALETLPRMAVTVRERVEPLLHRLDVQYPDEATEIRAVIERELKEQLPRLVAPVTRLIRFAFESTFGFVLSLINALVVPVFAGYLLYDMNRIRAGVVGFIPPRTRDWWLTRLRRIDALFAAFARGQITVCLILGTFYALGLSFLGVPLGLVAGFVIGFFNLIPFMSYIAGLPLALVLAWAGGLPPISLLWVAAVFTFGQFVEGNFISPRIVGESIGLHSLVIMLAVLVGGTSFGFAGMLLAVPVTSAFSVFWPDLVDWYKSTPFYGSAPLTSQTTPASGVATTPPTGEETVPEQLRVRRLDVLERPRASDRG